MLIKRGHEILCTKRLPTEVCRKRKKESSVGRGKKTKKKAERGQNVEQKKRLYGEKAFEENRCGEGKDKISRLCKN